MFGPVAQIGLITASSFAGQAATNILGRSAVKEGISQFTKALPFGSGYAFGTYIGFPGNYNRKSYNSRVSTFSLDMPYGSGKIRVWSRKYRRYVWVYPRRSYGQRYQRYYRRY